MANRFWIGGSGNWNSTAHWSATSGGAGGVSVPGSSDDVFIDTNSISGSTIINLNVAASCRDLTISDMSSIGVSIGTNPGNANLFSIYGSLTNNNKSYTAIYSDIAFKATSTGKTIDLGVDNEQGIIVATTSAGILFDGVGGAWTLLHEFYIYGYIYLKNGSLDLNGNLIITQGFNSSYSSTRSLIFNGGQFDIVDSPGGFDLIGWDVGDATNLTLGMSDGLINISCFSVLSSPSFNGGGLTYNSVIFSLGVTDSALTVFSSNTFAVLLLTSSQSASNIVFYFDSATTQTTSGYISMQGASDSILKLRSGGEGEPGYFLYSTSSPEIQYVDAQDCFAQGTIPFVDFPGGVDSGGNTNWIFGSAPGFYYGDNNVIYES